MEWFDADGYTLARALVQRGVAAVHVVAFVAVLQQFRPLLGERGLLPVRAFTARVPFRASPSLFHRWYSDRLVVLVGWVGVVVALTLVVGLPQQGPPWLPLLAFAVLWVLYLSVVNVGQVFYGFGWESLLLEAGFLAAFLGSDDVPPPLPVLVLLWWLVLRLELGAGLIKMRGDRAWRDLTALYYHHETQPMPGPLSRLFHLLPRPLHRVEVLANHVTQLVVPFGLLVPGPVASTAAAIMIATQLWLVLSGNFAWLNWLTIVLACSAIDDASWRWALGLVGVDLGPVAPVGDPPAWYVVVVLAVAALCVWLSRHPLRNLLSRHQAMNASFNALHLVNAYGAFGSVTRRRTEVVVEGTRDADPGAATWLEYEFRGKPTDVRRLPRQYAPYHLRLDWGMWFLALGSSSQLRWFVPFLGRLLDADGPTLRLLAHDPFDGAPPRWVRARLYRYRFATREQRRATGQRWVREAEGLLVDATDRARLARLQ
ncbi:lipase maturation factor family protein [Cellulomonas dongxiuzhuiae]|uniref:Lipase maturation factor family protein n=1 Tax=Cellulomonas dongxiuzhuiae TaxID=2819979 RepID=A0ABX8GPP0_9CELL|nr:lipase maturation factor family protein [Cellulomonas dongxiuzhuiae]MBO3093381.1 lipase maturation factor family protein [Cellulomonas dongxiuzhuiae]QWC17656.1 lipase maturation factor family protein [Cellulomonas dongxiuzhuiae]